MKKISIFVLAVVMAFTMVACGRRTDEQDTTPNQDGTTNNDENIVPDVIPDMDQNIPDANVDDSMPEPSIDTEDGVNNNESPQQDNGQNTADDNMGRTQK